MARPGRKRGAAGAGTDPAGARTKTHRPGHGRDGGRQWLYGRHAVRAALANPDRHPDRLLVARPELAEALADLAARAGLSPTMTSGAELSALLPGGAVHQGVALRSTAPAPPSLTGLLAGLEGDALVVVLDHVTDPRNVGAILRSAAAFGAAAVIQQDRHGAAATGVLAKAASGGLERVPLLSVVNISRALDQMARAGFWRLGLDAAATRDMDAERPDGRIALVLGAEGAGLRRLTRTHCDETIRIRTTDAITSLNVSTAAAIALHTLRRPGRVSRLT